MKLVICQPYLNAYGGMEKVLLKIAQHFDAKIYCLDYSPKKTFQEFKSLDIEIIKPKPNFTVLQNMYKKRPALNRSVTWAGYAWTFYNTRLKDYDLINPHTVPAEWIRNKNAPVVWYNHGIMREVFDQAKIRRKQKGIIGAPIHWAFSELFFKTIEKNILHRIEHIFTNSMFTSKLLKKHFGVNAEPLYPATEYKTFSCKNYEKTFLCLTRIIPDKRLHLAIEAFRQFQKKDKGWNLIIAGGLKKGFGVEENYYKTLLSKAGNGVKIIANIPEKQKLKLLSNCYTLLFPSINEPFGIAPLEAMGSKKPVITMKDAGGPLETIIHGKTGFIVDSVEQMAEKMHYLATHPKENEEMGKNGCRHVTKNFTWKNFLNTFEKRCKQVVKKYND